MSHFSGVCALFCPSLTDGQISIIGKKLIDGKGRLMARGGSSISKPPVIDFNTLTHLVLPDAEAVGVTLPALRRKLRCSTLPAALPHIVTIAWIIRSAAGKARLDEAHFRVPVLPEPEPEPEPLPEPTAVPAVTTEETEEKGELQWEGGGKRPRLESHDQHASSAAVHPPSSSSSSSFSSCSAAPFPSYRPNYAQIAAEAPRDASGRPVSFKGVLSPYAARPRDFPSSVYFAERGSTASFSDQADLVVVYDRYPKARVHLLVLPSRRFLASEGIADLAAGQLDRVAEMHALGRRLADWLQGQEQGQGRKVEIRAGYHAIPSIPHLHLHIFSSDLDSSHLSKKAHWNSFTTPFLVPPERVERALRDQGSCADIVRSFRDGSSAGYGWTAQQAMRCPRCGVEGRSLPGMKSHYTQCGAEG